jgi:hypothetical protein
MKKYKTFNNFLSKIEKTDTCWLWTGAQIPKGYGMFWYGGKLGYAHRYSYLVYKGIIPKELHVCHTCDNPSCVNPEHLWLGTNLDNRLDSKTKGRIKKGPAHWNFASGVFTKESLDKPDGTT